MKMSKKFLSLIMCLLVVLSFSTVAYASEYDTGEPVLYGGGEQKEYKTLDQQKAEYLARTDKTDAEKQEAAAHFDRLKELQQGKPVMMRRSSYNSLAMTFYSQENDYYCGPATLRQTYKYFHTGTPPTQDEIAEEVGTTQKNGTEVSKMKEYLNNHTSHAYADTWWFASQTAFANTIIDSIDNDIPVIAHITVSTNQAGRLRPSDTTKWPKATGGHYLNIRGYSGSGSAFMVVDPYGDRTEGYEDGKYSVSQTLLYNTKNYIIV